jgi:hypothetical protein
MTTSHDRVPPREAAGLLLLFGACSPNQRFDSERGRVPPTILGSSVSSGTEMRALIEVRPYERPGAEGELPHLVVRVTGAVGAEIVEVDLHYRVLHFPGREQLTTEQYATVQNAVDRVLRGDGTGVSREYEAGVRGTVEAAVPIDHLSDLEYPAQEYVITWGVGATASRGEDPLNAALAGSLVWDGSEVYSLNIPD